MRVCFFLGKLGTGGAERQYVQIASALARSGHSIRFITVYPDGQQWEALKQDDNVDLVSLFASKGKFPFRSVFHFFGSVWKLRNEAARSDILYSGLHLPNLMAFFATRGRSKPKLVWGIRASDMTLNRRRAIPRSLCAWFSPKVDALISNSYAGLRYHQGLGYRVENEHVVPNGIDSAHYTFSPESRANLREELGLRESDVAIGLVARLDPMKGHESFLRAFAEVAKSRSDVKAIIVGRGGAEITQSLRFLASELGISEDVFWLGERRDLPALYSAMDVYCLSSIYGEGFPNVVGEAMSCGLPAVVTDVGDAGRIVDNAEDVVPPGESSVLAAAILRKITPGVSREEESRELIESRYSVPAIAQATEEIFDSLV